MPLEVLEVVEVVIAIEFEVLKGGQGLAWHSDQVCFVCFNCRAAITCADKGIKAIESVFSLILFLVGGVCCWECCSGCDRLRDVHQAHQVVKVGHFWKLLDATGRSFRHFLLAFLWLRGGLARSQGQSGKLHVARILKLVKFTPVIIVDFVFLSNCGYLSCGGNG